MYGTLRSQTPQANVGELRVLWSSCWQLFNKSIFNIHTVNEREVPSCYWSWRGTYKILKSCSDQCIFTLWFCYLGDHINPCCCVWYEKRITMKFCRTNRNKMYFNLYMIIGIFSDDFSQNMIRLSRHVGICENLKQIFFRTVRLDLWYFA